MSSLYYFVIVGATDNPIYETDIVPSSRSSAYTDNSRVRSSKKRKLLAESAGENMQERTVMV